jgi:hypothetical protein
MRESNKNAVSALRVFVILFLVFLYGCGGGSGGGSGGDGGPASSGLMPEAPSVGAVLVADAASLRPLRSGSVLTYRGVRSTAVPQTVYTNTITQITDGAGIREDASDRYGDGPDRGTPVVIDAGAIKQRDVIELVEGGASEAFELVELRSPVRVNDRYVALDKHLDNAGIDLDGDRINDAVDVAMWAQVVREETLDLSNRLGVKTVRVDTTVKLRAQYSTDKKYSDVVEVRVSNWYAAGLGIVKSRLDSPNSNVPTVREIVEETLVNVDSGDGGLGYTAPLAQVAPPNSNIAGLPIPVAEDAVSFDTHAVVLTPAPATASAFGFALTQLDNRGRVLASTAYRYDRYPNVVFGGRNPRLLRVGGELRLFFQSDAGLHMASADSTGQMLSNEAPLLIAETTYSSSESTSYFVAASGSTIWVAWMNYPSYVNGDYESILRLQRFAADGAVVGAPIVAEGAVNPLSVQALQLSGSADRVVLSWSKATSALALDWRYLVADAASGAVLATHRLSPMPASGACDAPGSPLWLNSSLVFVCGARTPAGLIPVAADLAPLRAVNGDVRVDALLPPSWVRQAGTFSSLLGGERLTFADSRIAIFWPEDVLESGFLRFAEMSATGAVLDTAGLRLLARVPGGIDPRKVLPMGNRLLVVGSDCFCGGGTLHTMVVWR